MEVPESPQGEEKEAQEDEDEHWVDDLLGEERQQDDSDGMESDDEELLDFERDRVELEVTDQVFALKEQSNQKEFYELSFVMEVQKTGHFKDFVVNATNDEASDVYDGFGVANSGKVVKPSRGGTASRHSETTLRTWMNNSGPVRNNFVSDCCVPHLSFTHSPSSPIYTECSQMR
jgi:hypothetical protein